MTNFGCLSLWKRPKFGPMDSRVCSRRAFLNASNSISISISIIYLSIYIYIYTTAIIISMLLYMPSHHRSQVSLLSTDAQRPTRNVGASHADTGPPDHGVSNTYHWHWSKDHLPFVHQPGFDPGMLTTAMPLCFCAIFGGSKLLKSHPDVVVSWGFAPVQVWVLQA
jgi:hypothetical protein